MRCADWNKATSNLSVVIGTKIWFILLYYCLQLSFASFFGIDRWLNISLLNSSGRLLDGGGSLLNSSGRLLDGGGRLLDGGGRLLDGGFLV